MGEEWRTLLGKFKYEDLSPEDQRRLDASITQAASCSDAEAALWLLAMDCWTQRITDAFDPTQNENNQK
jgi:hypothetical protein